MTDKCSIDFEGEMTKLKQRIDIANLRTLMIFGSYDTSVDCVLKNAFEEVKHLRVLFIRMNTEESLPNNFPKLIHLRFLKIHSPSSVEIYLPNTLSQFYHLKFLNLKDCGPHTKLPENISRLCNIRHFFASRESHSNVPEVGKWKNLQELKEFHVNKGSVGFEIGQLGDLTELGGKLTIRNLGEVKTKQEAIKARLIGKKNLNGLTLDWGEQQLPVGADVLDSLQPHSNLLELGIFDLPGSIGPSWLCSDISLQNLESLHLKGVSSATLPPFGQIPHLRALSLEKITGLRQFRLAFLGEFAPLQSIRFDNMPELVEWVGDETCQLFPLLERVVCLGCPILSNLPILGFPYLRYLKILECPKLSLPPMPHTSTLKFFYVDDQIRYSQRRYYDIRININGYKGDLAFHHLGEVERMRIADWPVGPSNEDHEEVVLELKLSSCKSLELFTAKKCKNLIMAVEDGGDLTSLHTVDIIDCGRMFSRWSTEKATQTINPFPASLKKLRIQYDPSMKSMGLLSNLTSLTQLVLTKCDKLTIDGFNPLITMNLTFLVIIQCGSVAVDLLSELARVTQTLPLGAFRLKFLTVDSISAVLVAPICSRLTTLVSLNFSLDMEAEGFTEEQEQALQLLTSLVTVKFFRCEALQSLPEGLHCLPSLRKLEINGSPKLKSLPKKYLPASLKTLSVYNCSLEFEEECKILKGTRPNMEL